ncbi:hypothetical protein GCM10009590_24390 [Brachybacterium alimentarium]
MDSPSDQCLDERGGVERRVGLDGGGLGEGDDDADASHERDDNSGRAQRPHCTYECIVPGRSAARCVRGPADPSCSGALPRCSRDALAMLSGCAGDALATPWGGGPSGAQCGATEDRCIFMRHRGDTSPFLFV